jgi:zinc protease
VRFGRQRFVRINQTEAEGVPLFWAEAPAPFAANIVFRTGRADETLPTAGITHLIEHLAFPAREFPGIDMNGTVNGTETMFWAAGPRERALEAFDEILGRLGRITIERLENERRILQIEAASFSGSPVTASAAFRFGPVGHGLSAYEELGLYVVDQDAVEEWWRQRFTAENAVIWMTGKPPSKLEIPLLRGERKPMPELTPARDVELPAHNTSGPSGGVAGALLAERSFSVSTAFKIATNRLRQRLRFEQGLTYGAQGIYEPLTGETAHAVLFADCLDEHAVAVRDTLLSVLRDLATQGPTAEELREHLAAFRAALAEPSETAGFVYGRAGEELVPRPAHTPEELAEGVAAVTSTSAAAAVADALGTLILTTPEGTGDTLDVFKPYPWASGRRVAGRAHRLRGLNLSRDMRRARLVAGPEGVTLVSPDGELLTVMFAECVAVRRWTDGTRGLWSEDGMYVEVLPAAWRDGDEIVRLIDENVPSSRVVPAEPELEERIESVKSAARFSKVKRSWMTSEEFDLLPNVLGEGERVEAVAKATRGWRAGLVAMTDRRFVFVYFDSVLIDVPLTAITAIESDSGSMWRENSLTISTAGDSHKLTDIGPKEQLDDLARAIEQARRAGD